MKKIKIHNSDIKVTGCFSISVYLKILLTTEPIWFTFKVKPLTGSRKVYNYFVGRYLQHPPKRNRPLKEITKKNIFYFSLKANIKSGM